MEKENIIIKMEIYMMENEGMMIEMEKESFITMMEIDLKANGRMIKEKEKELCFL